MNKATTAEAQAKEIVCPSKLTTKRVREDKFRKKDEKSLEHVFRALDGLGTTEHKLGAMCQKYAEMYNDHRMLQAAVKQSEKRNSILQKEKEQLQSEHSKAILTRSRLENLCRELQRQNKVVKEECMLKMREESEKKREVATKFHSMLSEIGSLLAQNNNKNAKLRDDNLDMSMRLKSVCDQFEKKEQHVENLAKQMELEMQLADAKLAKAKMEMNIEKETLEKEKQQLVIELSEYKRKLVEMKASELSLREQITMYSNKYEEFHQALLQSNTAIGDFKAEMERMTKHIRRLEKETATWMSRYDSAQRSLVEVSQAKLKSDSALALSQRRLTALQGICRGLQDQLRQLRGERKRDSQQEEDLRLLEDQIKEVERSAQIESESCFTLITTDVNATYETEPTFDSESKSTGANQTISGPLIGDLCSEIDEPMITSSEIVTKISDEALDKESLIPKLSVSPATLDASENYPNNRVSDITDGLCSQSPEANNTDPTSVNNSLSPEQFVKCSKSDSANSLANNLENISLLDDCSCLKNNCKDSDNNYNEQENISNENLYAKTVDDPCKINSNGNCPSEIYKSIDLENVNDSENTYSSSSFECPNEESAVDLKDTLANDSLEDTNHNKNKKKRKIKK